MSKEGTNGQAKNGLERLLTSAEVGEILGICPQVYERMARKGKAPGFKVGRFWRCSKSALDSWIAAKLESARQLSRTENSL
jgi:excisionase family DNA binding protein